MSAVYYAKIDAVDKQEKLVTLTLRDAGQEQQWPDSTAAGLFLLLESADKLVREAPCPMKREGHGVEKWIDHRWLFEHAKTYVESFDPVGGSGEIGKDADASMAFELRVTDIRWMAHLNRGARWDSTCPSI